MVLISQRLTCCMSRNHLYVKTGLVLSLQMPRLVAPHQCVIAASCPGYLLRTAQWEAEGCRSHIMHVMSHF